MLSTSSAEEEETCATEVKISSADEPQEMQEQIYWVTTNCTLLTPKKHGICSTSCYRSEAAKAILLFPYVLIAMQAFWRDIMF